MKCPECGSRDVGGHSDPKIEAAGIWECCSCGFAGLDDGFEEEDEIEDGDMKCCECGFVGPAEDFMNFPEEFTFVSSVCPECNHADLD